MKIIKQFNKANELAVKEGLPGYSQIITLDNFLVDNAEAKLPSRGSNPDDIFVLNSTIRSHFHLMIN